MLCIANCGVIARDDFIGRAVPCESLDTSPRGMVGSCSTTTCPLVSNPRRPARPAIWMNSCGWNMRRSCPSNFSSDSKTTVLAGPLTPIANVSVETNTGSMPEQKRCSMISLQCGIIPAWCTPTPPAA
ncbi:hypothetical protein ATCV1_z599L [Acanthocystis turfacea chlorella virus 1]|uniref:Uncharacterized protein z599L n=1 Tax=Chlorovirus heliozoae TaxID=322019 RepID=A7K9K9_9PHYC|nr:hypothetical protein ATCV1_z599L [Acanthocystis turfacea chlorella virus 1]ABT16733.1 hypothetical protein ATCV1_z599L [Acanthocystis turfacea chlorella virus 1]